jgi:hypothetical protein
MKFRYFRVFSSGKYLIKINEINRSRSGRVVDKTKPSGYVGSSIEIARRLVAQAFVPVLLA